MPSVDDSNITPGTGKITYPDAPPTSGTVSGASVAGQASVSHSDYVVPHNQGGNAFVNLSDGPGGIITNALLVGGSGDLQWTAVPSSSNEVLVWTGTTYVWQALPAFTGVLTAVIPFTEVTGTTAVGTFNNITLIRAKVVVKTAFGTSSTIDVGTTSSYNSVIPNSDIIQSQVGLYTDELYIPYSVSTLINITVNAVSSSSGIGTLILEYITGVL